MSDVKTADVVTKATAPISPAVREREYDARARYKGQALVGLLLATRLGSHGNPLTAEAAATLAYQAGVLADAMLAEDGKPR